MSLLLASTRLTTPPTDLETPMMGIRTLPSKNQSPISTLLDLPPELLSQIFICYKQLFNLPLQFLEGFHDFDDERPEPGNDTIRAILILGSISNHLRKIAWSTPQLWSHIVFCLRAGGSCAQVAGLDSWLARSNNLPISIRIQCVKEGESGWDSTVPLAVMQAITSHSLRWEDLYLDVPPDCYTLFFKHVRTHDLTLLKRLTLSSCSPLDVSPFIAPLLTDIYLIDIPTQSSMHAIPWRQIKRFHGRDLYIRCVVDVLLIDAPLESCTITSLFGHLPSTHAPIRHSHLKNLSLNGDAAISLLGFLTLPAIEKLSIRGDEGYDYGLSAEQFVQFIQRSGCAYTFQSLDISVEFISDTALLWCLTAVPGLRELKIHNRRDRVHSLFANFIIERLIFYRDRPVLIPRLKRLEVLGCACRFDADVLSTMLESRWYADREVDVVRMGVDVNVPVGRLESFHLEASHDALTRTFRKELMRSPRSSRLIEQGMAIY